MNTRWHKSIRVKLILSYLFVIFTSMAVTGFYFGLKMKQVLEESRVRETATQAKVIAGAIGALSSGPENIIGQGEVIAERYSDDKSRRLRVYSSDGLLVADSAEKSIGYLNPGEIPLYELFPSTPYMEEVSVRWTDQSPDGPLYYHGTWTIFHPRKIELYEPYTGAVDISAPLDPMDPAKEEKLKTLQDEFSQIGAQLATAMEMELARTPDLSKAAENVIKREKINPAYRVRVYNIRRYLVAGTQTVQSDLPPESARPENTGWYETGADGRILNVSIPITGAISGASAGSLVLSGSVRFIDSAYGDLQKLLIYAIGISLLITLIISVFLANTLVQPIDGIRKVTERLAEGDFTILVDYQGEDEIRSLADAINSMSGRIQDDIFQITGEKEKMNALLTALPDGVMALDRSGRILFLNRSAGSIIGEAPERAIGGNLREIWTESRIGEFFDEGLEKTGLFSREIQLASRFIKLYLIPYGTGEESGGLMMIIRDITDLRRLEDTRTHFLGSISHELRTPLTVIKGFVHAIIDDEPVKSDESAQKALKIIDNETDRLARLVQDLLELSRLRSRKLSMEMETVAIDDLLQETAAQMAPNARRMGIELKALPNPAVTDIYGDRDRLKQVIINLIDNAIKYTPQGGRVQVESSADAERWTLVISDNGSGIAEDELPFLFERFFRTRDRDKKKYIKGTGLGMAIVKEIVDAHRGVIEVESRIGEGTSIKIRLPVNPPLDLPEKPSL